MVQLEQAKSGLYPSLAKSRLASASVQGDSTPATPAPTGNMAAGQKVKIITQAIKDEVAENVSKWKTTMTKGTIAYFIAGMFFTFVAATTFCTGAIFSLSLGIPLLITAGSIALIALVILAKTLHSQDLFLYQTIEAHKEDFEDYILSRYQRQDNKLDVAGLYEYNESFLRERNSPQNIPIEIQLVDTQQFQPLN